VTKRGTSSYARLGSSQSAGMMSASASLQSPTDDRHRRPAAPPRDAAGSRPPAHASAAYRVPSPRIKFNEAAGVSHQVSTSPARLTSQLSTAPALPVFLFILPRTRLTTERATGTLRLPRSLPFPGPLVPPLLPPPPPLPLSSPVHTGD
jgi:hypothetical protein